MSRKRRSPSAGSGQAFDSSAAADSLRMTVVGGMTGVGIEKDLKKIDRYKDKARPPKQTGFVGEFRSDLG
jgi:hypothetical protein